MLSFPYLDYRSKMARAKWSIGTRTATKYFTIHYNGPSVKGAGNPDKEIAQLQFDATYHMRPGALNSVNGGDGLQYHGATLANGINLQLRDWNAKLWHCGNAEGNSYSIAWHIPIGGTQWPSSQQLTQLFNIVIPAFRKEYPAIVVQHVMGHKEWKDTLCPGIPLFNALLKWRDNQPVGAVIWFQALRNLNIRQSPEVKPGNIALNGTAVITAGTVFAADHLLEGVPFDGQSTWIHRLDGLGFVLMHPELVKQV